jgi:hypothetical protein
MAIYRTQNERYILSFIGGRYDLQHKTTYPSIIPTIVRNLIHEVGHDEAFAVVEEVIQKIEARKTKARDSLKAYEMKVYLEWLDMIRNKLVHKAQLRRNARPISAETVTNTIESIMSNLKRTG